MRWTFDPMVARNAWLNLGKLGAVVDRFARNFYGEMDDAINAGERSDRLTVAWHLQREPGPHVVAQPPTDLLVRSDDEFPVPRAPAENGPARGRVIELPSEYHDLRTADPVLAHRMARRDRRRRRGVPRRQDVSAPRSTASGPHTSSPRPDAIEGGL